MTRRRDRLDGPRWGARQLGWRRPAATPWRCGHVTLPIRWTKDVGYPKSMKSSGSEPNVKRRPEMLVGKIRM